MSDILVELTDAATVEINLPEEDNSDEVQVYNQYIELSESTPIEIALPEKDNAIEMEVYYQDEVSLDTDLSLLYIKSGEKEIENYVETVSKPEIESYIVEEAKPIVANVVDQIATPIIDNYFEGTIKPAISQFADEEMAAYAETATTQANIATSAATEAATQAGLAEASAVSAIATSQTVDTKVAEFETTKNNAINSVNQAKASAISAIDSEVEVGKSEVNAIKNSAVTTINTTAEQATSTVQSIANDAQQYATQAGQSASQAANSAESAKADADAAKMAADNAFGKINNVGDIFYTTRLDKELNGAVECNGETYNTGDFSGIQSIGELLAKGSLPYVGLEEYANIVLTNGSCRAFGWDGGAEFKVPTLNDVYIEAGNAETAGEFIAESLPNITGTFVAAQSPNNGETDTGAFTNTYLNNQSNQYRNSEVYHYNYTHTFDASRASEAYQEGAKVKPDSVRYRAMVQLATTMNDDALITATATLQETRTLANEAITKLDGFDTTVDNAETEINTALEEALERIEHAGDIAANGISITYWE